MVDWKVEWKAALKVFSLVVTRVAEKDAWMVVK